jgi:hypothetical protein
MTDIAHERLRHLRQRELDLLFSHLSVDTVPVGTWRGRAWLSGWPIVGWLARLVWYGNVFEGCGATNRILGLSVCRGVVSITDREILIDYPFRPLRGTLRQCSPLLYLGRLRMWGLTVNFTLSQKEHPP